MPEYLVLDVGGSGIKHAIADAGFHLRDKGIIPNTLTSHAEFVETIGALYDPVADRIAGVALSTAGEVDPATGHMHTGGALTFNTETNMLASIGARCPTRISVENDANCALLAEVADGALAGCRDAAVIVLGTGIGGAVMVDGKVRHGTHFHAGNLSVLMSNMLDPDPGRPLAHDVGVAGLTGPFAVATGVERADGRAFFAALDAGDRVAARLLDEYASRVAALAFNVQMVLDLEGIAIGGGISVQPALIAAITRHFRRLYTGLPVPLPPPRLEVCRYFNDANLRGALVHHLRSAG